MVTEGRIAKVRVNVKQAKEGALVCEVCGAVFEVDPESGERRCPVCDIPEE